MAWASAATSALSMGGGSIALVAGIVQSIQQYKQLKYDEKQTQKAGLIAASNRRAEARKLLAAQRAAIASSGLEESGSTLDLLQTTAGEEELAALRVHYGFTRRARNLGDQAKWTMIGGILKGAGTGLESIAQGVAAGYGAPAGVGAAGSASTVSAASGVSYSRPEPTSFSTNMTGYGVRNYSTAPLGFQGYGIRNYPPISRTGNNTFRF